MKRSVRAALAAFTSLASLCLAPQVQAQQSADTAGADRMIVFGDSLSDGGYFLQFVPLAPGEGSFTTNPDPVAPEVLAALLGYQLQTAYGKGGTNYAIGGARITQPNPLSTLAIPIATQISNFLAAGNTFGVGDTVYIQGGGNDYFNFLAGGGTNTAILTGAATALAAQVQRLEQLGAGRIVTLAIQSDNAGLDLFNATYKSALAANGANVLFFDTALLFNEIVAAPATFGITNITGTACRGSSLSCGPEDYVTPDANRTYLLADSVHPAGITQQIQGQAVASLFTGVTLTRSLARSGQRALRAHASQIEGAQRNGAGDGTGLALFGLAAFDTMSEDNGGLDEDAVGGTIGVTYDVSDTLGLGLAVGYRKGDGSLGGFADVGEVDSETLMGSAFARAGLGPVRALADVTYGQGDVDLVRNIALGPAVRMQSSATETRLLAARGSLGLDLVDAPVRLGPEIGIGYERVRVDGFTEDGGFSTSLTLDELEFESLTGRAGIVASAPLAAGTGFFARVSYVREFEDDPLAFAITPTGAPVTYRSTTDYGDRDYGEVAGGVSGNIGAISLRAGASAEFGRADLSAVNVHAGVSVPF